MHLEENIRKTRGDRIRQLRSLTYMSRKQFAEKHHIPYHTLQNWEDGRFGGLSKKGAQTLAHIFRQEGILVTSMWLLYKEGNAPQKFFPNLPLLNNTGEMDALSKELHTYYENNVGATHILVPDSRMEPRFYKGEYVAGIQKSLAELRNYFNKDCIVYTRNGENIICRPQPFIKKLNVVEDHIQLTFLKTNSPTRSIPLNEIIYFAPITWTRS